MARKNRPVLFELASRQAAARPTEEPQLPPGVTVPPAPGATATPGTAAPSGPAATPRSEAAPFLRKPQSPWNILSRQGGGRFYRTLGWQHLAIGAAGLVVLIAVISFANRFGQSDERSLGLPESGASAEKSSPPTATDKPRSAPIADHRRAPRGRQATQPPPPLPGPAASPRGDATKPEARQEPPANPPKAQPEGPAATDEPFTPQAGQSYVVIQHVSRSSSGQAAAQGIREFLNSRGVRCAVRQGGGDLEVVATEPFATRQDNVTAATQEKARALQLMEQIRKLGQEYKAIGRYTFDKCYLREPKK